MSDTPNQMRNVIVDTVDLLERLAYYYETPEECVVWFRSPQPLLGDAIPIDLIAEGRVADLNRVWDALDSGAYI